MAWWAAAAAVVGSVLANKSNKGDGGAASSLQASIDQFNRINIPTPEDLSYEIERYRTEEGIRNPQQLYTGDLQQGNTGLEGIQADQNVLDTQMNAMTDLNQVAQEGITAQEQADIQNLMGQESRRQKGSREAILQNMEERGLAGSGQELAAQLLNQQASADRGSQTAFDTAALGKQRALEALSASGNLAGRIRGQDYGEQAQAAKAQDAINAFNINNETATRAANFDRNFGAAQLRQNINENNADIATQQRAQVGDNLKYQTQAEMNRAAGASGQYANLANSQQQQSQQNADRRSNMISGIASAAGNYFAQDENKANVETRAKGGPVEEGKPYLIGEEGMELMIPKEDGEIVPNDDTNSILNSLTGMNYEPRSLLDADEPKRDKLLESTVIDIQDRLRNIERNKMGLV